MQQAPGVGPGLEVAAGGQSGYQFSLHPPPLALIQFICTKKSFVPILMLAVDRLPPPRSSAPPSPPPAPPG